MAAHIHRKGPIDPIQVPVKLSSSVPANTINVGDLVCMAASYAGAIPVTAVTWDTDEATTQTAAAASFLGISCSRSRAATTDARDLTIQVATDGYIEFACVSDNYDIGEYLGCDSAASLLKQTVKVTSTKAKAIAIVVELAGSASTRVLGRLINTPSKR